MFSAGRRASSMVRLPAEPMLAPGDRERHGRGSGLAGDVFGVAGAVVAHRVLGRAVGGWLMFAG
ncbi:hypothetical protein C3486_33905 [Streptomyces sp. Ru73]|nr:hypothetical protein C3486_33905 [Streptomyces sp. Ru73]